MHPKSHFIANSVIFIIVSILTGCKAPFTIESSAHITPQGQFAYGKADAPIVITEYTDFQCPTCQYFAAKIKDPFLWDDMQAGKVKFVISDFPLQRHKNATLAAAAARCAKEPIPFWKFHDALFQRQAEWAQDKSPKKIFSEIATAIGISVEKFEVCLASKREEVYVMKSFRENSKIGVNSTPSFAVNGKLISWDGIDDLDVMMLEVTERVREIQMFSK
jgi:protein-disulfide isomerase